MAWLILEEWEPRDLPDVYHSRAYMGLYRTDASKPVLFRYESGGEVYRLPYMESELRAYLPDAPEGMKDMESAYGYGGPWSTSMDPGFLEGAMLALDQCCRERGILAGFIRFHPLLENHGLAPSFQIIHERDTVAVDLTDPDPWTNQVSQKNRNMIRKAEREGLSVHLDAGFEGLPAFRTLYQETMGRLGAQDFYRLEDAYFEGLRASLGRNAFLAHCRLGGEIIASALIMTWGDFGHYHLSGSRLEFQSLAPNNLLLYRIAIALKEKGLRIFHMGGGRTSDPADPLLKFKKSFSPHLRPYHVGRRIFFEHEYARLRDGWVRAHPDRVPVTGARILFYR